MSLLLNEDFTTYQLRLSFLNHHRHDGVGERLINLPTGVLNNPAFRAAGWVPDTQAVKRCYSPPIPTTGAPAAVDGYFRVPTRNRGFSLEDEQDGQEDAGGMVTGRGANEDIIAAGALAPNERKRRQRTRREMLEEDDSSDLDSDESDEEERSAVHSIQFAKMPVRDRSKSSPANPLDAEVEKDSPALMVTSPSRPPEAILQGLRRGSLGQVGVIKQRARRDTTTSSEMSSETEGLDPNVFNRKLPGRPGGQRRVLLQERIQEEEGSMLEGGDAGGAGAARDDDGVDSDLDSDLGEVSDLSDEFDVDAGTQDSPSLLAMGGGMGIGGVSSSPRPVRTTMPAIPAQPLNDSPGKAGRTIDTSALKPLPRLPGGRPISTIKPSSLISMALKGPSSGQGGEKPFQRFADLDGKGDPSPIWIKIYAPFSKTPTKAIEVPIRRQKDGTPVKVTDLIGLALWRYNEEGFEPPLDGEEGRNINWWTLRIVEDEEVDFDFPALVRTRNVTDFTSNNNRPPQRRARDKPWDEFGLVKATEEQYAENEALTPSIGAGTPAGSTPAVSTPRLGGSNASSRPVTAQRVPAESSGHVPRSTTPALNAPRNPITGPSFSATALRKETGGALDLPQRDEAQYTPRTGAAKIITLHFTDANTFASTTLDIDTTADTYIAEIFAEGCKKLNLDKALYVLKVHGTQTVAPSDRTVEALGDKLHLDLVRRRFIGAGIGVGDGVFGLGLSGSPGSTSPNAPLELDNVGTPGNSAGKKKRGIYGGTTYVTNQSTLNVGLGLDMGGKRYNVLRKQPLSFAPSHPRTLIITPEYLQILPGAAPGTPGALAPSGGKVTTVPMSSIVGVKASRKHPKMMRVMVFRGSAAGTGQETKRYDFECESSGVATEIVGDIRRALEGLE